MAVTVATIKRDFGRRFKGADDAFFLRLLNQADTLIVRHFKIRKKTLFLAITEDSALISLDSRAVWIEACRWANAPAGTQGQLGGYTLAESNIDQKDTEGWDWRANAPGPPSEFMITADETGGQIQLDNPSQYTTLVVAAATNASPIAVTFNRAHGLSDGNRVDIRNGLVNTAVNGDFYINVTGSTTGELYSDSALTIPVAGNGIYTASSAIALATNSPWLQVFTIWHVEMDANSSLPDVPLYPDIYIDLICFLYAKAHELQYAPQYKELFENMVSEQFFLTQQRGGRKPMRIRVVNQRGCRSVKSSWETGWSNF